MAWPDCSARCGLLGSRRKGFLPVERAGSCSPRASWASTELVQHEVLGVSADQGVEIGQGLAVSAQSVQRPHAVVAGRIARRVRGENPGEIGRSLLREAEVEGEQPALETGVVVVGLARARGWRRLAHPPRLPAS